MDNSQRIGLATALLFLPLLTLRAVLHFNAWLKEQ